LKLLIGEDESPNRFKVLRRRQVFVKRIDNNGSLDLDWLTHIRGIKEQSPAKTSVWWAGCPFDDGFRPEGDHRTNGFVRGFLPRDISSQVKSGASGYRD